MVMAVPGGIGCMSWLQEQLKGAKGQVYLNRHFKDVIEDFRCLAADVCVRPTRIAELVPDPPLHVGCSNAVGPGMSGVWLPDALDLYASSLGANSAPVKDINKATLAAKSLARLGQRDRPAKTDAKPEERP